MKTMKFMMSVLSVAILLTGCNMSNTGKGAIIGTTAGAAAGTGLGALIGKLTGNTKMGAGIGAAAGAAVGATGTALKAKAKGLTGGKKLLSSAGVLSAESAIFTAGTMAFLTFIGA